MTRKQTIQQLCKEAAEYNKFKYNLKLSQLELKRATDKILKDESIDLLFNEFANALTEKFTTIAYPDVAVK